MYIFFYISSFLIPFSFYNLSKIIGSGLAIRFAGFSSVPKIKFF